MSDVGIGSTARVFAELPEELDENWVGGFVLGGIAHHTQQRDLARSYKLAADALVDTVRERRVEPHEIGYPMLHLYRQCIELYLKAVVQPKHRPDHDLVSLASRFAGVVWAELGVRVPDVFLARVLEFAVKDPKGTAFRFADDRARGYVLAQNESWVELTRLHREMDRLVRGFENVLGALSDAHAG